MKRIVIVHKEMGIYVDNAWGIGFWTLLNNAGQPSVCTFENVEVAKAYVAGWQSHNDPTDYTYVLTSTSDGTYALAHDLISAGLGDMIGDLAENEADLKGT